MSGRIGDRVIEDVLDPLREGTAIAGGRPIHGDEAVLQIDILPADFAAVAPAGMGVK